MTKPCECLLAPSSGLFRRRPTSAAARYRLLPGWTERTVRYCQQKNLWALAAERHAALPLVQRVRERLMSETSFNPTLLRAPYICGRWRRSFPERTWNGTCSSWPANLRHGPMPWKSGHAMQSKLGAADHPARRGPKRAPLTTKSVSPERQRAHCHFNCTSKRGAPSSPRP